MKICIYTGFEEIGQPDLDTIELFPTIETFMGWLTPQEAKRLAFELERAAEKATDRERKQAADRIGKE